MEDEDCALVCYLIAEDNPNYEFLDDDDDIHTLVSAIDAKSSCHGSIHVRRLVPKERVDGGSYANTLLPILFTPLKSFVKGSV